MRTKLILGLSSVVIALASLPLFAAFEAHVINVTAKIENAIQATPSEITFGTVFPQEKLDKSLTISLSDSFREQSRVSLVYYVIRQKPKCVDVQGNHPPVIEDTQGNFFCPGGSTMMPLLCPYLSMTSPKSGDQDVKPFHGSITNWTLTDTRNWQASSVLDTSDPERDASTTWNIDLKVPCFAGMCAQDWKKFVQDNGPAEVVPSNYIQPTENEHKIFGCDLWVETIHITTEPSPSFCGDGTIQQPNGTGTGGPNNDGYEQCDTYDIDGYHCSSNCTIVVPEITPPVLSCASGQSATVLLEDQDSSGTFLDSNDKQGILVYCVKENTFTFAFSGRAPIANDWYALVIGNDPRNNPENAVIVSYPRSGSTMGEINVSRSVELNRDLSNAQAWLIQGANLNLLPSYEGYTGWNSYHPERYLFGIGLIDYNDLEVTP